MRKQKKRHDAPPVAVKRRAEAREKIVRKLALLQKWEAVGVPPGLSAPESLEQFRTWENELLGAERIGSKGTINQPWNADLKLQVERVLGILTARKGEDAAHVDTASRRSARQAAEIKELKAFTRKLASQYSATREDLTRARGRLAQAERRVSDLQAERAKLLAELTEHRRLIQAL